MCFYKNVYLISNIIIQTIFKIAVSFSFWLISWATLLLSDRLESLVCKAVRRRSRSRTSAFNNSISVDNLLIDVSWVVICGYLCSGVRVIKG